MEIVVIGIIVVVIIVGAIALVVIGLRSPRAEDPLQSRLAEFAESGKQVTLEEIELSQSFTDRIIMPIARSLGEFVLRFTPQNSIQDISRKMEQAGWTMDPTMYFLLRICGLALGGVGLLFGAIAPEGNQLKQPAIMFGMSIILSLLGFMLPQIFMSSAITRRQNEVRKYMPDALDLLTICVEAGLGFDAAMAKVYEKWDNELGRAFGRVIKEIQLGKIRREALRDMSERLGIAEMTSFVAAVIQSEQLGVSMAQVLRIQSDQMRVKRRQHAEELAHQAPIKMLMPMVLLIFPALCIVLMTPAILTIITSPFMSIGK